VAGIVGPPQDVHSCSLEFRTPSSFGKLCAWKDDSLTGPVGLFDQTKAFGIALRYEDPDGKAASFAHRSLLNLLFKL